MFDFYSYKCKTATSGEGMCKTTYAEFDFLRLGENNLSVETVEVIADVLRVQEV